jgi:chemotaxis response regulator CheB
LRPDIVTMDIEMSQAVEKAGLSDKVLPLSEIGPMLSRCV